MGGSARPKTFPQMQELVRRGVSVLPTLIQHLNDKHPTKFNVGKDFAFRYFSDEYDPKKPNNDEEHPLERRFNGDYSVKVGDVCYVIIGQIVNRDLYVLRYQPSMGLVVNSPIEAPVLIKKVKKDWGSLNKKAHLASLLADADLNSDLWYKPALQRLRFYYPEEYRNQKTGKLKDKIAELESAEKAKLE